MKPALNNFQYTILLLMIALWGCNSKKTALKQSEKKPNIVFILIDDLGWSDTAFMGNPVYETPNLNQLVQESAVFSDAYAPAANCAPSRACIMTGQNTPRHGIYTVGSSERGKSKNRKLIPTKNTLHLNESATTLAEALRKNGYKSASIGKWHLGKTPLSQGFDINIAGSKAGHPKSYFSPYKNKQLKDGEDGEYLTDRLTDEAIGFMKQNKDNPFFLYLPYFTVHTPIQSKPKTVEKYKAKINGDKRFNPKFGAMIEHMDENIGRLLQSLKEEKLEENTLLVFLSDNGGLAYVSSQFPLRAGKGSYYEGGIRVPCIIRWPKKIKTAQKIASPITGMDIFPTLMDVVKDTTNYQLDGVSLLPLLTKQEPLQERSLFWHFPIYLQKVNSKKDEARDPLFRTRPGTVMRKGKWKLHHYFEDNAYELYNLESDIKELTDLSKQHPEKVAALKKEMETWRIQTNAPIPNELNKEYQPKTQSK